MVTIICVFFLIIFCIALYGWGLLLHHLSGSRVRNPFISITLGLGAIIFLGGVLNLLRFAYGWAFDGLLLLGIVLAVIFRKQAPEFPHNKSAWLYVTILGILVTAIMTFIIATQFPPAAFNIHDDFEKYFAHPVRMLQTGTLFGSPLSAIGYQTLGGQAVLHGIILNHFSIPYINGADAILGLFLCLALSVGLIPLRASFLPVSIICLFVVLFIHPQYVNVSTLYIASALMMTTILLFSSGYSNEKQNDLPQPLFIGIIYASLVATKPIFLLFPVLHFSCLMITLKVFGLETRRLILWGLKTGCLALLFISPWIFLHLPYYIQTSPLPTPPFVPGIVGEFPGFLSNTPLFYGGSFAHYTFLSIIILLIIFVFFLCNYREQIQAQLVFSAGLTASAVTIFISYFLLIMLGSLFSGYESNLRYAVPFLIAGVPLIFPLDYIWFLKNIHARFKLFASTAALLLGLSILVFFSKSFTDRIHQAYQSGSILGFSKLAASYDYIEYNKEVLFGNTKLRIATAQKHIPEGKAFVVWLMTPFYLNYKRNVIFDADPAGLSAPWSYIPDTDYFMLEYSGYAVRLPDYYRYIAQFSIRKEQYVAKRSLIVMKHLVDAAQNADILYDDGKIVVFKKR